MTEKKKQLDLLTMLFDKIRPDCTEEWTNETYLLADIINIVGKSTEQTLKELILADAIDCLTNVYNIPKGVAKKYTNNGEFKDNLRRQVAAAVETEVEELVAATDILKHQTTEDEPVFNDYAEYMDDPKDGVICTQN